MGTLKLISILIFISPLTLKGQLRIDARDSVEIKNQIEGFYSWYIDMTKNKGLGNFNPQFVKNEVGMTTLDFEKYKSGLRRYRFTDEFIQRKVRDYKPCVDNLARISFDEFSRFQDLDDFENISCDFQNRYEWTGGMEPADKAELASLKMIDKRTIVGQVEFTSNGGATVTWKKVKKVWFIDNLQLD